MGIDVIVQTEAGEELMSLDDPHSLLPILLTRIDVSNTACVRFINPYDDAVFSQAQAVVLVSELEGLRLQASGATAEFLDGAIVLARHVASDVHLCIMFRGD